MDSDHEDYVFCGTPIESEEQVTTRKKKAVAEASGHLRSLPAWKQEVTDEEGRRRFHGAFTGGFAAGYYNTVGSKEGWTPQTFTSSRKNRAEVKQQSILNFLDEDEKSELEGQSLKTSMQFDTFGFTSAEIARKQAEKEQHERPSAIPGPVPDELILPTTESIGVKLLLKMGWRHGHSIKDSRANSLYDARREARKAFLAFSTDDANVASDAEPVKGDLESLVEQPTNDDVNSSQSTPVYVLHPKNDLHGLGFDPFKHAPEFREKKRSRVSGNRESGYRKSVTVRESLFGFKQKVAPGFGIGALEELDAEDEDVYSTSFEFEDTHVEEEEKEPSELIIDNKKRLNGKERGVLLGFRIASKSDYQLERFDPPVIPKDFIPQHKFPGPLETDNKVADPPPREVPPPEDSNLKLLTEGVATLVAKCGKLFEDLSREKNQSNPLFSFLAGGNGSDYYARKLWEEQQKHNNDKTKLQFVGKLSPSVQQMTAESRGRILGEKPLERDSKDSNLPVASDLVHLQVNLKDTFTKPASFDELPKVAKPFTADPAKQERFERFLKEKYEGGLRSTYSGGTSNMSESARARERLDFEAAAEAIEKGKWTRDNKLSAPQFMEFAAAGGTKFTSGGLEQVKDVQAEDLIMKKLYPKREEFQWRPAPVLCKRFDLTDPYMGKPPPPPRIKSKMDSLIFMPDYVKATKVEETEIMNRNTNSAPQSDPLETTDDNEKEVEVESVERPVDLYKAIFSDDSDDEGDIPILNKVENPEKKAEAANTTLNRLIAGDFLESLGKELGLEVPPEMPCPMNKAKTGARTENANVNVGNAESETTHSAGVSRHQEIAHSTSKELVRGFSENVSVKANKEKVVAQEHTKADNFSDTSSSEDERSRKHCRRVRYKSSDSSSEDRHRSRDRKREPHREKSRSSSRKHSHRHKHHKRTVLPADLIVIKIKIGEKARERSGNGGIERFCFLYYNSI